MKKKKIRKLLKSLREKPAFHEGGFVGKESGGILPMGRMPDPWWKAMREPVKIFEGNISTEDYRALDDAAKSNLPWHGYRITTICTLHLEKDAISVEVHGYPDTPHDLIAGFPYITRKPAKIHEGKISIKDYHAAIDAIATETPWRGHTVTEVGPALDVGGEDLSTTILGIPLQFQEVYPEGVPDCPMIIKGSPMSISHWGLIDLGDFGVMYFNGEAHWQFKGETFDVRRQQ